MFKKTRLIATSYLPAQYKEIAKHFSYLFALRVAQQLIGFVSFFFIVHYVPKEIIGHYQFVLSVIALVSITSLPGMRGALMQSVARKRGGFFKTATRYSVIGAVAGSLILLIIAGYHFVINDLMMAIAFAVAALLNPLGQGLLTWKSSYSGEERFKALAVIDAMSSLITSAFLMISALFYNESHILLLCIALIIPAIQNFIFWGIEFRKYKASSVGEDGMKEYGLKTSAYQIFPTVAGQIDRISIYNFMSASDLAAYSVAMKIPEALKSVIQNLGDVLMPKFAKLPKFTPKMDKTMGMFSLLSLVVIIGFAFTVFPLIFKFLVPSEYESSIYYVQALLCTVAIGNHAILRSKYIKSQKDAENFKRLVTMNSIIRVVSMPVFIFFLGIWGAVAAIFIQRIITSIFTEYLIIKYYKMSNS